MIAYTVRPELNGNRTFVGRFIQSHLYGVKIKAKLPLIGKIQELKKSILLKHLLFPLI
jgi:hypothetical protein